MLFTSDHDLPNSLVNKIIVDKDGLVWIATEDGLCKFDGSDFITYWNEPGNPNSIQSNFVRTLCCDKQGHILVGSLVGVQIYRPETDDFTPVIINEECGVYAGGNVSGFLALNNGDVLACGNITFSIHFNEKGMPEAVANEFTGKVYGSQSAVQDGYGNIWVAQQSGNTYRLNSIGELVTLKDHQGRPFPVSTIQLGPDGKIYAGASVSGLLRYNSITEQFDTLATNNEQFYVRDICVIPNTRMLSIGTDGNGVKFFNCENGHLIDNLFNDPFIDASTLKAHTLAISPEGTVWVGVYQKGVIMVSPALTQFHYIGSRSARYNLIGDQCVTAIMTDHDRNVWVGTDNGGISGISPDGKQIAQYLPTGLPNSVPASIMTLFEDSRNRVWVGSYHEGLGWINLKTGAYQPARFEGLNGETSNIYQFIEDKRGEIWIASMGLGILRYDEHSRTVKAVTNGHPSSWICDMVYNSTSDKLFAGTYNGLCIYDLSKDNLPVEQVLYEYVIHDVNEYAPNQLCLCTNHGLVLYDYNTKLPRLLNKSDGLPSNNVLASECDGDGNLWISSSAGITKFDIARGSFNNFTVQDGLQGNEFYKKSSMHHPDGSLWFGGINGISWFTPADISRQSQHCQVRVVGVSSDQTHILPDKEGIYQLNDEEHAFTIVLATLPLNYTKRVLYSYSMDGAHWQTLPPLTNRISFSGVSFGSHTFRFKATCDGVETEEGTLSIHIAHPWYHSWWAICLLVVLITSLAYLLMLHLMRKRQMRERIRQHRQNEAINEAKLQFFMNIAHEFRTPMTLIVSPLQKLINNDKDEARQHSYQLIERNANRILNLINQLMDLRKIDKEQMHLNCQLTNLGVTVADLCHTVSDLAEARNIKLQILDQCPTDTQIWLDSDCFEKILLNLLSNSLKYTPSEGQIEVSTSKHAANSTFPDGYVKVCVTDTGIGIPELEKAHVFDRFYQVRQNNKHVVGTGIGLNLVYSLVKLHHGDISVTDNPEGQGTCFTVCLPMGSSCFKSDEMLNDVPTTSVKHLKSDTPSVAIDRAIKPQVEEETAQGGRRRILLVDDDDEIRNYLHEELSALYLVVDCSDGQAAIDQMAHESFDLVITDLMMPGVDGAQLCKKIRGNILLNHLPIIMLTAKSSDEDHISGLKLGVDAFIAKPFNIEVVKSTVQNLLRAHDRLKNTFNGNQTPTVEHDTSELQTPDERLLQRINKAIADNLDKTSLTTDDIASAVGVSRVHLYRKLKELTNQSARSYIRNIRLMKAAELLSQKRMPISDVSYACGFGNANNFSTAFRDLYGMSPTEYMEAKLEDQQALLKRKATESGFEE